MKVAVRVSYWDDLWRNVESSCAIEGVRVRNRGVVGRLGRLIARSDADQFTLEYWWFSWEPVEDEL